jgi:hypothetical protein
VAFRRLVDFLMKSDPIWSIAGNAKCSVHSSHSRHKWTRIALPEKTHIHSPASDINRALQEQGNGPLIGNDSNKSKFDSIGN